MALARTVRTLLKRPEAKGLLAVASTAGDLAGAPKGMDGALKSMEQLSATLFSSDYRVPFFDLGNAMDAIYRATLLERYPEAVPPPGTLMVMERHLAGSVQTNWRNVGDDEKIEREDRDALALRLNATQKAKDAQSRFLGE